MQTIRDRLGLNFRYTMLVDKKGNFIRDHKDLEHLTVAIISKFSFK